AAGSLETSCHLPFESIERFSGDIGRVRKELESAAAGQDVFIVCQTEAEAKRLEEVFGEAAISSPAAPSSRAAGGADAARLHFPIGHLRAGFRFVPEHVVLLSGNELFHRTELVRPTGRRLGRVIDSFLELRKGDL